MDFLFFIIFLNMKIQPSRKARFSLNLDQINLLFLLVGELYIDLVSERPFFITCAQPGNAETMMMEQRQ